MTELVLADFLAVDPSRPYVEQGSFFEIELAGREGRPHQTCGGRSLNDDVMDTLFTLWVNAGNGPRIRDGVDQATEPAIASSFPTWRPRIRILPDLPRGIENGGPNEPAAAPTPTVDLELDDIQYGASTNARPPMSQPTCWFASTTGRPAGSCCAGCVRWSARLVPRATRPATRGHGGAHLPGPQGARASPSLAG